MPLQSRASLALIAGFLTVAPPWASGQHDDPDRTAGNWPMWGGSASRNPVSAQTGIPAHWDVGSNTNVRWVAPLGTQVYGTPIVAGGRAFVSTNNGGQFRPHSTGDKGCLVCFDARHGTLLWQATHDKLPTGELNDYPQTGIASTPYVTGERIYYVSNRCELVCADVRGFYDGENDGPCTSEKFTEIQDADFVWVLDMISELGVFPHALAASSPVGAGDLVFVGTGNGLGADYEEPSAKPPAPNAPSIVAVNQNTGKVVWKRNDPGMHILHGQWSSPAHGVIDGTPQVVFGGGDGWCYGYEARTGELLWRFNLNPKGAVWGRGGRGGTKVNIIATPVIHQNRVFLGGGNDPDGDGPGHLYAIDATRRGDITGGGQIWHVGGADFGRTVSTVVIADGLLYAADCAGHLYCLDVDTGRRHWKYDMEARVWGSPIVVDGKVILGNVDGDVHVLKHGKKQEKLAVNEMRRPIYTTVTPANGALYIATQRRLYAIGSTLPEFSRERNTQTTRPR